MTPEVLKVLSRVDLYNLLLICISFGNKLNQLIFSKQLNILFAVLLYMSLPVTYGKPSWQVSSSQNV